MKEIVSDPRLVAACGLYCGACGAYRRGRCPGCSGNQKAAWCGVRTCCLHNGRSSCAECSRYPDARACPQFNNFVSKVVGFLLRSDRAACIDQIRAAGLQAHADRMAQERRQSIRR
jgi:hypothetical protein